MTVESLALPVGMTWGEQSGDYRIILKEGKPFTAFGGLYCKVSPSSEWQMDLDYVISNAKREALRNDR